MEPGPAPPLEGRHTAKYNVVASAGLILPDGEEAGRELQTATSLAPEKERDLCPAEINPQTQNRWRSERTASELVSIFKKPLTGKKDPLHVRTNCFVSCHRAFYDGL